MRVPADLPCATLLDSIADGLFTVDLDWNVTFFNQAAARITGVSPEEAVGSKCWDVFHSSLCDGQCALRSCMDHGRTISNKTIAFVRADGRKVPVSISAAALAGPDGRVLGGVETFRDLSELHALRKEMEGAYTFEDIVGKSESLQRVFRILPQVAKSEATVLLLGESGTGKELFARAIHTLSLRRKRPFVAVNCGALPEALLESELFGYKAGAFTDAKRDKPGRLKTAQGGTLFLDEIGDLPPGVQVKLLRVLQERTYDPLGAVRSETADVRVIAATNRDLETMAADGTYRQDLFYRLNVAQLRLPPLRERPEDIPLLAEHAVRKLNLLRGKDIQGLSEDVLAALMRHPFPGNVRELENLLEFAFILCPGGFIQAEHLPDSLRAATGRTTAAAQGPLTLEQVKHRAVREALARHRGRKMAVCRELGISKDTLRRMLARCADPGAK